jgi:hypothetical protein
MYQMLIQKFEDFKQDTTNIGNERLAKTNEVCDQLIGTGHSDAAIIAQHKDTVNEAWANLLELMNTRIQVLLHTVVLFHSPPNITICHVMSYHNTTLYHAEPYNTLPYQTIPYHASPYHTIHHHTSHTIPCFTIHHLQGAIIRVLTYRRYANITVWYFQPRTT